MRARAIALAKQGFRVFPLVANGKTPAVEADWRWLASSDPLRVHGLWTDAFDNGTDHNIGIAIDDDTVVIDVDVKDGRKGAESLALLEMIYDPLPWTYTVRTASGGWHRYFKTPVPLANTVGKLGANIDTRGRSGFVVAPGSIINGVEYEVTAPITRALVPQWVIDDVGRAPERVNEKSRTPLVDLDQESNIKRAEAWLDRQEAGQAVEGAGGDSATYAIAARVIDFGLSVETARDVMLDHWNDRQSPPWDPSELETKVRNAWNFRQNPVGIADAEVEFEDMTSEMPTASAEPRSSKRAKLYHEWWRSNVLAKGAPYLIKGWYDYGSMVVTYGESNSGKTNVVLNQAFAIACGRPWHKAKVKQGLVVYVAAEGGRGLRKRIAAYHKRFGVADIPFATIPCPVDLLRPNGDTKALIALVKAIEVECGHSCVMVVLDTLSRVLAGGNENAPDDMGALVMHCDRLRFETGATVHLIHHSGKNQAAGARGHSLLRAATDTEVEVTPGTIDGTKQRDMDKPSKLSFKLEDVILGVDDEGDTIHSVVAVVEDVNEFEQKLTGGDEQHYRRFKRLVILHMGLAPPDAPVFTDDEICDKWTITPEMCAYQVMTSQYRSTATPRQTDAASKKAVERALTELEKKCCLSSVAVKGKETLWFLTPGQTATNSDSPSST